MIALGWMGWSEEQALCTDVNAIIIAYEGRMDMFEQVGWIKRATPSHSGRELTPEMFDAVFG